MRGRQTKNGFTIVELMVVIVIIALLAVISYVGFSAVQRQGHESALMSDLTNAASVLALDYKIDGKYPLTGSAANAGKGLAASDGVSLSYEHDIINDEYCVTATSNRSDVSPYHIRSSLTRPESGTCPANFGDVNVTWTQKTTPVGLWMGIDSSADGTKWVASMNNGPIYTSTNSGSSWVSRTASQAWFDVRSSADGQNLVATTDTSIYTSTDSGVTWTLRYSKTGATIQALASSADGSQIVAVDNASTSQTMYRSGNGGTTWTQLSPPAKSWTEIASSADGSTLIAAAQGEYLYKSTNSGTSWTAVTTSLGPRSWYDVNMSDDGKVIIAGSTGGTVVISRDSGATWTVKNVSTSGYYMGTDTSADGSIMVVVRGDTGSGTGYIHMSYDGGESWVQQTAAGNRNWGTVGISGAGRNIVAGLRNTSATSLYLYTGQF